MLTKNFTDREGEQKPLTLFCSADIISEIYYHLIFLSVFNIVLSITAVLGNSLVLVALHKASTLHPPSKLLLRSLSATDLCVGLVAQPVAVSQWLSAVYKQWEICRFSLTTSFIVGYSLSSVSLLTVTAISADRLLALLLGLRYRQLVTLKRTRVVAVVFWLVCIIFASMYFWNFLITLWCSYIGIPLCLLTSVCCYTRIFFSLRHHQTQVLQREQPSQTTSLETPLNIARYRKAVSTALWLQLALVVCYLPHGIVEALFTHSRQSSFEFFVRQLTGTFVNLNSSLNPILYCWKIREVRQAVKAATEQFLC